MATPLIGAPGVLTPVLYDYDQFGRSTGQTDPRTGRTAITEYNAQGQVDRTVDLAGNTTFYEYYATGNGAGQVKKVTHQDGGCTSFVYIDGWFERNRSWFGGRSVERRKIGARKIGPGWRELHNLRQLMGE